MKESIWIQQIFLNVLNFRLRLRPSFYFKWLWRKEMSCINNWSWNSPDKRVMKPLFPSGAGVCKLGYESWICLGHWCFVGFFLQILHVLGPTTDSEEPCAAPIADIVPVLVIECVDIIYMCTMHVFWELDNVLESFVAMLTWLVKDRYFFSFYLCEVVKGVHIDLIH